MTEQGDHHGEAEERRYGPEREQHRHDHAPGRHRHRVSCDDAQRRHHRLERAGMTVQHQGERHDADAERGEREQEAGAAADRDQPPASLRGQHARHEVRESGDALVAECRDIDRLRGRNPGDEQGEQQRAEAEHRTERRRAQHLHGIPGAGRFITFAPAGQLVESQRREWPDQRKAGSQRKQQRQHRIAHHRAGEHEAEHRVDHAEDDGVARNGLEVFPATPERVLQIGQSDGSDHRSSRIRGLGHPGDVALIECGHGR